MIAPPLELPAAIDSLLSAWEATAPSQALAESAVLFPAVECFHVIALALTVGSIVIVDLRLLGIAGRRRPIREVTRAVLPLTWTAFACAALSGLTLFSAKPTTYGHNPFFLAKLALIAAAGVNMLVFHLLLEGRMRAGPARLAGRLAAGLSLALWVGVVTLGRWVGFTI